MARIDAKTATAADFDHAAQKHANAFWVYLLIAGAVWYFASIWWALIPAALALLTGARSIGSTRAAAQLREGRYPIFNVNNGAPDGNAGNWSAEG